MVAAMQAFRSGERLRRQGRSEDAQTYYERASKLCPGSWLDALAKQRVNEMRALIGVARSEEEQAAPEPDRR